MDEWSRNRIDEVVRKVETRFDDMTRQQQEVFVGGSRVPITFLNTSAETIPPYAVMAVVDADALPNGQSLLKVDKPGATDDTGTVYAVNEGRPVGANTFGQCVVSGWATVAYDTGTPVNGNAYGPSAGNWTATLSGTPGLYVCCGIYNSRKQIMLALIQSQPPPPIQIGLALVPSGTLSETSSPKGVIYNASDLIPESPSGITILSPTAAGQPFVQVSDAGLWEFTFSCQYGQYSITGPTWYCTTSFLPAGANWPCITFTITFQQDTGGTLTSLGQFTERVYFFEYYDAAAFRLSEFSFLAQLNAGDGIIVHIQATPLDGAAAGDSLMFPTMQMIMRKVG
jgi:hypothetical protein